MTMQRSKSRDLELPPVRVPAVSSGALATGAVATGALAVGALAVGALAIGALAIGRMKIRRAEAQTLRLGKVEIDDLTVKRLRVIETVTEDTDETAQANR